MKIKKATVVLLAGAVAASLMLGGCGNRIDQDEVVATMGDQEVSLGYVYFVARYNQATYDSMFLSYYGEGYWTDENYVNDDGQTMEDIVKSYIIDDIETDLLMEAHMSEYGVEISDEERESMQEAAQQFMEDNSDETIEAMGATEEYVEEMLYYQTVRSKMTEAIQATADTDVSDEECARRTFSYIQIDMEGYTDDSGSYVTYTDDEAAAVEEDALVIAELAQSDFEGAAETYSYDVSTYSYGQDEADEDDGFADEVIAAADEMTEGEVSDLIEADGYYYIIRLDSENDEEAAESAREEIISERQAEKYTEVTEAWAEESDFELDEDVWAKVTFTDAFTVDSSTDDADDSSTDDSGTDDTDDSSTDDSGTDDTDDSSTDDSDTDDTDDSSASEE